MSFRTNVIMSTICGTNITVSGLTNAIASDGDLEISSSLFSSVCGTGGHGTWDNTRKELVLILNQDVAADTEVAFSFRVKNPAVPQDCPEIVLFTHGLHAEAHQVVMGQSPATACAMRVCVQQGLQDTPSSVLPSRARQTLCAYSSP